MIPGKQQKGESVQHHPTSTGTVAWAYHPALGWNFVRLLPPLTVQSVRQETWKLGLADFHGMAQEVSEGDWIWLAARAPSDLGNPDEEGRCSSEASAKYAVLGAMTRLGIIARPRLDFPVIRNLDVRSIQSVAALRHTETEGEA